MRPLRRPGPTQARDPGRAGSSAGQDRRGVGPSRPLASRGDPAGDVEPSQALGTSYLDALKHLIGSS